MRLNQVTVPALDVETSIDFYRGLGLRLIVRALPHYARFETRDGESTFSVHMVDVVAQGPGAVVYFECTDLDARVEQLQARGYVFEQLPKDEPWLWREARLRDPSSNVVCLYWAGSNRRFPPWRVHEPEPPGDGTCCATSPPPDQPREESMTTNLDIVRALYQAFAVGDVPSVLGALAPTVHWIEAEGGPYGGVSVGPDAVLSNVFMRIGGEWDGFTAVPKEFVTEGSTVVALGEYSGTYKATGKSFQAPFAHVWKLEGGKVVSFHQHTDTAVHLRPLQG